MGTPWSNTQKVAVGRDTFNPLWFIGGLAMDDQEQLIQQLQADKDQLTAKLEALQTEYDQPVANLKLSEDKVKSLMVENQRLLIRQPSKEVTDSELFAPFFK